VAPADARLRVEVLGPLRVWDTVGRDVTPQGGLQRRLFALLVLRRGRVVSTDSAIEALWPSDVPRDPAAALQNHLSRLRRGLPAGLIESVAGGYRLDPTGVELDADRLGRIVTGDGDDAAAWRELHATLDRWRGPAFSELDDVDDGRDEAGRLEELRIRPRRSARRRACSEATPRASS
jgi:DNA-binding SARP family transcriptional activator